MKTQDARRRTRAPWLAAQGCEARAYTIFSCHLATHMLSISMIHLPFLSGQLFDTTSTGPTLGRRQLAEARLRGKNPTQLSLRRWPEGKVSVIQTLPMLRRIAEDQVRPGPLKRTFGRPIFVHRCSNHNAWRQAATPQPACVSALRLTRRHTKTPEVTEVRTFPASTILEHRQKQENIQRCASEKVMFRVAS